MKKLMYEFLSNILNKLKEIIVILINKNNEEGNVSLFSVITFTALILIVFMLIDYARIEKTKNDISSIGLICLDSTFSGYNKELKNEYGLFALCMQEGYEIEDEIKERFLENININHNTLGRFKLSNIEILSDKNLENIDELERQIIKYMKVRQVGLALDTSKNIISLIKNILFYEDKKEIVKNEKLSPVSEEEYEDIKNYKNKDMRDEVEEKINKTDFKFKTNEDNSEDNSEDGFEDVVIPTLFLENGLNKYIDSNMCIDKKIEDYSNEKSIKKDDVTNDIDDNNIKEENKNAVSDNVLVSEYVMMKFNNLSNKKNNSNRLFDAEVEFIIGGNLSQNENIKIVKQKILNILNPVRLVEVYNDEVRKEEAEAIARAVCGWWATEAGVTVAKNLILVSMALDISNDDYEKLVEGNSIELFKNTNINASYEDFLRINIYSMKRELKLTRIMCLVDINMKTHNILFNMKSSRSFIEVKISGKEKFIFMTRRCLTAKFRRRDEIEIERILTYGY